MTGKSRYPWCYLVFRLGGRGQRIVAGASSSWRRHDGKLQVVYGMF